MDTRLKTLKARVTERGKVTIPKQLQEQLGIGPGSVLEFSEEHGRLIAVKTTAIDPVGEFLGCLGKKFNTDAVVAQLRGR
jgi:AbrB family looped-hinge helix DNA binding protein